jgi:hypothetical protein
MDDYEPLRWRDCFRAKWVIFAGGLAFFVIALRVQDGWGVGRTIIVLAIAGMAAVMAVGLDQVK